VSVESFRGETQQFENVPCPLFPIVAFDHRFGFHLASVQARFPHPESVKISKRSVLVLKGDVTILSLNLDGALVIEAAPGVKVVVKDWTIKNEGWEAVPVAEFSARRRQLKESGSVADDDVSEVDAIRGFKLLRKETEKYVFNEPGEFVLPTKSGL
jgi:hypothetical protein